MLMSMSMSRHPVVIASDSIIQAAIDGINKPEGNECNISAYPNLPVCQSL